MGAAVMVLTMLSIVLLLLVPQVVLSIPTLAQDGLGFGLNGFDLERVRGAAGWHSQLEAAPSTDDAPSRVDGFRAAEP